ncbi:MAG TPA: CrcB family protein [Cellulomonas sp.]|uniref:fluoride efflux transporter FluC n=1 Tax=Cellulomonas sp. TaxID=40001 RepID=UPI002E315AAA|nr:CrcB family protein [Cellulomonas sp.]HEX5333544.1 CrcB family protein [Cellulomonas sp.]
MTLLLVALLGGLGAATRFIVDGLIRGRWSRVFPLATVLINVSGSALLGLLAGALAYHSLSTTVYLVAAVGFCGGYTTFSTAMVETVRLAQSGDYRRAVANALGTLLLAVAAAALGVLVMWLLA